MILTIVGAVPSVSYECVSLDLLKVYGIIGRSIVGNSNHFRILVRILLSSHHHVLLLMLIPLTAYAPY